MNTIEAAKVAGVTATTIRKWIANGRLEAGTASIAGPPWFVWDITEEALAAAIAAQRKPGRPHKHPQAPALRRRWRQAMKFLICNAFSINMLPREGQDVAFVPVNVDAVRNLLSHEVWESAVGHADTAAVFSDVIGVQIPVARVNVALRRHETRLIVGQYRGPRLPEGATMLPEGATIEWWQVYHY